MNKTKNKGRYLCKVGFLDIYAQDTYRKINTSRGRFTKPEVENTNIAIYHGKKLIKNGFKNKEETIEFTKEFLS